MNPARSFAPALIHGRCWEAHYVRSIAALSERLNVCLQSTLLVATSCAQVYWIGPILGAVAGAVLYKWVLAKSWTLGQQRDSEPDKWPGSYELTPVPAESRPSAVATGRRSENYEADPTNI